MEGSKKPFRQKRFPLRRRSQARFFGSVSTIAALLLAFGILAQEVNNGVPLALDQKVMLALRDPANPSVPAGPAWWHDAARDITGLGSTMVLAMVTLAVMGYLFLARRPRVAWMLLGAVLGGVALNSILKFTFARPRPDFIIHAEWVFTPSFPSGHATLSAITYSTIGVLLAQIHSSRRLRVYLMSMTGLLVLLIGVSRICLGVHYPTDVVGGWCIGVAWAMACWELMVWLQGSRSGRNRLISPDVHEPQG